MFGKKRKELEAALDAANQIARMNQEAAEEASERLAAIEEEAKKPTEADLIKKQIYDKAMAMAEDAYQKEIMFKSLQASDLHYAIIQDLMKAAQLTGLVTITLKDGSVIKIENKENARDQLNQADRLY